MRRRSHSSQEAEAAAESALSHQWLAEQLRKLYDHVLDEPVPDEMKQIIEDYERERGERRR